MPTAMSSLMGSAVNPPRWRCHPAWVSARDGPGPNRHYRVGGASGSRCRGASTPMGALVAVLQSDPNLMRCQVQRLDSHVAVTEPDRLPSAYGFGYYRNSDVLLGKRPSGAPVRMSLAQLAGAVDSEALVVHGRYATVGDQKDENTHPFRFRRWLFAHDGTIEAWREVKPRLIAALPDFLRRNVEGDTDSEYAFMVFLSHLRDAGHLDGLDTDARVIGRALAQTVRDIEGWSREAGATMPGTLNFVATNGRVLVATRLLQSNGFLDVPEASVVAVSRQLQVTVSPIAST